MVELNGTLLIQILNFIILCAILGHYCYKPIIKILDDRANRIKNDLDSAAKSRDDAAKLKESYEAVKEAEVQAQAQIQAAHEAIEKEKEAATKQIERERKDALDDLKSQFAAISCDIAAKIISTNMTPDINDRLINESIAKLDAQKAGK